MIAQTWAVLSNVATPALAHQALHAVEQRLVDSQAGLIRLLDPPLTDAVPNAGYTQSYPPGVRENGSQYSHAGVWALMAQAQACQTLTANQKQQAADTVYRYFTYLSPAHRAAHPTQGPVYGTEPYVIAGDVYSQPPYTGRGGWSWYTGSAAWLYRAALESMFGLCQGHSELSFYPCLPGSWSQAELTLTRDARTMRFIFLRQTPAGAQAVCETLKATLLPVGQALQWGLLPEQSCFVIPMILSPEPASFDTEQTLSR